MKPDALESYRAVKGMRDVFPEETLRFLTLENLARDWFARYGFGEIRTPIVELTTLFERGIGQGTDIVNKEMFYVPAKSQDEDGSGDPARRMVLRPEATASVARAVVEHETAKSSPGVQRYYYIGPMFRYERPQRGRLRQFTQVGIEYLGSDSPIADAEAITLAHDFLQATGAVPVELQLNSVGCPICRPGYVRGLQAFLRGTTDDLCADCRQRAEKNPLRLFDCKQHTCRAILANAPSIQDALCPGCRDHQDAVTGLLREAGVVFRLEPRLMRGLDYYTRTVFEIVSSALGAQNAVAAGGRYDGLVAELGGPPTPAVGWSLGLERLLELVPNTGERRDRPDVFVIAPDLAPETLFARVTALRRFGLKAAWETGSRSAKSLMKKADRAGARFALFVSGSGGASLALRNMQTGDQFDVTWDELPVRLRPPESA